LTATPNGRDGGRLGIVTKTLQPGQAGTARHLRLYGAQLVCVRYRVDPDRRCRYTTVELLVDEAPLPVDQPTDHWVYVRLERHELPLCRRIQALGGRFNKEHGLWQLRPTAAKRLRLLRRLVPISS
jgi:hypothetical protein